MLRGRRIRICIAIALVVKLTGDAECAITLNQVDSFQGITDNWTDGHSGNNVLVVGTGGPNGTGDPYLQVSSGSFGVEPRLITFNQMQWTGNYTAAGVGSIQLDLKNFGTASLPIRITIRDLIGNSGVGGYSSTTPFTLPSDGQWHLATFNLNAASMTAVSSPTDPLAVVLTKVADLRLLSSAAPSVIGDSISARIGIDEITALPPPPSAWTGATSVNWVDAGNWTGAVPGAITGTTNTNTATFNQSAARSPTTIDAGRNIQNITFDTAAVTSLTVGAVGGPSLLLTAGGTIQTTSTVANAQTVNAPLVLEGNCTFTSGASTTALNFGGGITPGPTSGTTTLTLNGGNTGANTISGVLADHSAGILALTKSGSGTWTLTGTNTYSGTTAVSSGRLKFNVAAGTPTIAAGATVTVAAGATLELAGSISALGAAGGNRAHITNSSTASGIVVSGTNQVVGAIDGSGTTQVNAGGALTADHIVQSALVIAGASGSLASVTIDASNASGNPLSDSLASPVGDSSAAGLYSTSAGALAAVGFISGDVSSVAADLGSPPPTNSLVGGSAGSVPEPSSVLLFMTGALFLANRKWARRRLSSKNERRREKGE
jgi:autotransporter-associated beta strand protein